MENILKSTAFSLLCDIRKDFKLSDEFLEFLSRDDQGIDGLDFMIKDSKLCRRIPSNVRIEYEIILANTSEDLDKELVLRLDFGKYNFSMENLPEGMSSKYYSEYIFTHNEYAFPYSKFIVGNKSKNNQK